MSKRNSGSAAHRPFVPREAWIAGLLVVALAVSGCAGLLQSPGRATAICGGAGALAGAAAGAALDKEDRARGAIIGALAGGLLAGASCFAIAKFSSTPIKDYQQTQAETGYKATQGTVVRVNSFTAEPATVAPGQELTFSAEYYVMTPNRDDDLPVVESMIMAYYDEKAKQWKEQGRTRNNVIIKPGTRALTPSTIAMPKAPISRNFRIVFQVEHDQVVDRKGQGISIAIPQASAPHAMAWTASEMGNGEIHVASSR